MKRNIKYQILNIKNKKIFLIFFGLILLYFLFSSLSQSLFFQKKDRLNLVFYGERTAFYSFGFKDEVNYFINFPSAIKILVPGGYGHYRLGGLGKLAALEKNPDLFRKSFSAAIGTFIDYYFFPYNEKIYFDNQTQEIFFPSIKQILLNKTNAGFFDRVYIFFLFAGKQKNQFLAITQIPFKKEAEDKILDQEKLFDHLIGYFFHPSYRKEKVYVQILYTKSDVTAKIIARIIEGQGIRVGDIDIDGSSGQKTSCQVIEDSDNHSLTAKNLSRYFNCRLIKEKTGHYDIIFRLGEREKEWEVE